MKTFHLAVGFAWVGLATAASGQPAPKSTAPPAAPPAAVRANAPAAPAPAGNIRFQFDGIPYGDVIERFAQMAGKPLLADTNHRVFDAYDVISTMMSLGQRPAVFVIDRQGVVRFDSIGTQQWQIPTNDNVLDILRSLQRD